MMAGGCSTRSPITPEQRVNGCRLGLAAYTATRPAILEKAAGLKDPAARAAVLAADAITLEGFAICVEQAGGETMPDGTTVA